MTGAEELGQAGALLRVEDLVELGQGADRGLAQIPQGVVVAREHLAHHLGVEVVGAHRFGEVSAAALPLLLHRTGGVAQLTDLLDEGSLLVRAQVELVGQVANESAGAATVVPAVVVVVMVPVTVVPAPVPASVAPVASGEQEQGEQPGEDQESVHVNTSVLTTVMRPG
jgi:hypothetical protein